MECKHQYFKLERGQLVCVQCGKKPNESVKIEDKTAPVEVKIGGRPEVKTIDERIIDNHSADGISGNGNRGDDGAGAHCSPVVPQKKKTVKRKKAAGH
jgi:hypothetical protein